MATIFVVESSANVRETLGIVLRTEHEVRAVPSLAELPEARPDLIVLGLPSPPRDDRGAGAILRERAPDVPILLLHAATEVDVQTLAPPYVTVEFLPKPFDAYALRARVRGLIGSVRGNAVAMDHGERHRCYLEFPFLPRHAAAVVRRAITADVPVLGIQGEIGTGMTRVARALHVVSGRWGSFVALDAALLASGELERRIVDAGGTRGATVYVAHLERADLVVQADLNALAERISTAEDGMRLVVSWTGDFDDAVAAGAFRAELAYRVTALPIVLTPLRERLEDVPALVELLSRDLCLRFGLEPVRYRPGALDRLQQYLWFGNVVELEAVLARTLVLHRPTVVDAEQLVFQAGETPRAVGERVARAPSVPESARDGLAGLDLEVVLGELAHELRNPMVTIKTFTQHLDSVLADPEVRSRFATLTADAIGRMDGLLETLLDFARFRSPVKQPVDLRTLLDRALAEHADELARRHVTIERNGTGDGAVEADEAQVFFAFRSLCRGLVPDLTAHAPLKVGATEHGVEIQVRTEPSTAARLAAWVEPRTADDREAPPLMWALAASLFERNGGTLSVRKAAADATMIRVDWTSA